MPLGKGSQTRIIGSGVVGIYGDNECQDNMGRTPQKKICYQVPMSILSTPMKTNALQER